MSEITPAYDTDVPPDESPVECPYCERPLESAELLVLHEGIEHWERLDDDRREEFRETYQDESDDLRTFRLKMLGLLVVVYFAFLFVYSIYTNDPLSAATLVGFGADALG
ncbi:C2H2-type zinc finger protein [Halorussus ruber]|uniref:C2H2-type zinc finger protein n=1 Tax=Halorussus ruber TaxID=1126238 RepID=UPI0010932D89|nr:C2H2-type zinc finger protein [Halorussus ruber]